MFVLVVPTGFRQGRVRGYPFSLAVTSPFLVLVFAGCWDHSRKNLVIEPWAPGRRSFDPDSRGRPLSPGSSARLAVGARKTAVEVKACFSFSVGFLCCSGMATSAPEGPPCPDSKSATFSTTKAALQVSVLSCCSSQGICVRRLLPAGPGDTAVQAVAAARVLPELTAHGCSGHHQAAVRGVTGLRGEGAGVLSLRLLGQTALRKMPAIGAKQLLHLSMRGLD